MAAWYENASLMTLLGVVVGAVAGTVGTIVTTNRNNAAADKRHILDMAYKAAFEEYKASIELAKYEGRAARIPPFYTYVVHQVTLINTLLYGKLMTKEEVLKRLEEVVAENRAVDEWVTKKDDERGHGP